MILDINTEEQAPARPIDFILIDVHPRQTWEDEEREYIRLAQEVTLFSQATNEMIGEIDARISRLSEERDKLLADREVLILDMYAQRKKSDRALRGYRISQVSPELYAEWLSEQGNL